MKTLQKIQIKFNQVSSQYQPYLHLPEYKFIRQLQYGILTSKHVHLNKIGSVLRERISLKKTTSRLSRNLGNDGLSERLIQAHLEVNRRSIKGCDYLVFDISDISKSYATEMEGMESVHDGSIGDVGYGYWLSNVLALDRTGSKVIPAYSELYALHHESEVESSENKKILHAITTVQDVVGKDQVIVIDRGGDRRVLIESFLQKRRYFIIRQTGKRDLHTGKKRCSLQSLSGKIRLLYRMRVEKDRHGKKKVDTYFCGAQRIYFPNDHTHSYWDIPLWLVKAQRKGKSCVWYLCYLPVEDEQSAIEIVMEGYGLRWKIEEYHRHIKDDYHLEQICLRRYTALKNFMSIFMIAMTFIYHHFESLSMEILIESRIKLVYREKKLKEYLGFIYYKMAKAVAWFFSNTTLQNRVTFPTNTVDDQLTLGIF
jgi:hypothetical protein